MKDRKQFFIIVLFVLSGVILFANYSSNTSITANITSDLTTEDSLNARLLAFDREVGGNLIATADINTISPDRFGSFSVTIPDDLLILPNVSYVQLCLDGDVSARPLSLADDANDPTTLPTTSSSSQSSLDGTADCNDATNAAHTYELTSCQRQPIPTNPSWLSRTFGTAQQTFHVDNFCGQVFASADVEQLAQTNQLPQLQLNGDTLTLGESSVDLSKYLQEDTQPTVITNTITGTGTDDQTIDASLSNQDLTVSIEDGGSVTVDLSAIDTDTTIPNTDNQALGLTGTTLSITGGNSIDLSPIDTDTDDQTLTFTPGTGILEIADGNTVDLSALYDNTDQLASLSCGVGQVASWNGSVWVCSTVSGGGVDADNQVISLAGNTLTLSGGLVPDTTVDLSSYLDNTDDQVIAASFAGNNLTISLEDGGVQVVDLSSLDDNGTDDQMLSLVGTDLTIEDGNTIDLSSIDTDTDDQTLSFNSGTGELTIADGNMVDMSAFFDDTTVDNQQISLSGNIITLDNGTGADTTVNLTPYLDNTDNQVLSISGNTLELTSDDGTDTVDLSGYLDNTDAQDLSLSGNTLALTNDGTTVDLSSYLDNTDTLAGLSCSPNQIAEWDGSAWVCLTPTNTNTDNQQIALAANIITLSNGTGADTTVNLSSYLDNTDELAGLSCSPNEIAKWSGAAWACAADNVDDADNNATNEIQDISLSGTTLTITSGSSIDLSPIDTDTDDQTLIFTPGTGDLEIADGNTVNLNALYDNTDNQVLSISGNNLQLSSDDGTDTIDLSSYLDNTDELASLSCSPTEIAKWNGTNWACAADEVDDADSSATNEIQDLSLSGNTLSLTSDGTTVDLSSYLDNTDELAGLSCSPNEIAKYSGAAWACAADIDTTIADDQTLSFNSGTGELTIADGNMVDMSAFFDDTTVDNQQISLSGNIITLDNGTGADTTVNLTPYLDNTDNQVLSISGNTLELTSDDGTDTVDLSGYLDNTDAQDLSLSGNTLALTNDGTTVDLSSYLDNTDTLAGLSCSPNQIAEWDGSAWVCLTPTNTNTDNQQIALAANIITLSNGTGADTTVNLSSYLDNTDELAGLSCSPNEIAKWSGAAWACAADNVDDADNNATNEIQDISLSGTTLTITSGSSIDLSPIDTDTDDQTLIFTPGTGDLEIADGNTVNLNALYDNTDNQVLSISGNNLQLSSDDGTDTIDLSSYLDNTDELASLSCSPTEIAKWNGTNWACAADEVDDADSSATNEIQDLSLSGNTLSLTSDGTTVDLSSYLDNTDELAGLSCSPNEIAKYSGAAWACAADIDTTIADDQTLSFNSGTGELTIADGNMVDMSAFFDDTTVDNQQISLSGNIITLDNGTGADTTVNLTPYLDNTDNQVLSISGNTLELTSDDGTDTVDLSGYLDNTDAQDLSLSGNTLALTNDGTTVDLSSYLDNTDTLAGLSCSPNQIAEWDGSAWVCLTPTNTNTDNQQIALAANIITLSNGTGADTTVNLSSYLDNTDELAGLSCSPNEIAKWSGAAWACAADNVDDADNNATNEIQDISLSGTTLTITSGSSIDLSPIDTDTDDQTLIFTPGTGDLEIADGNTVNLNALYDNTDNQVLSISGNNLQLSSDDGTDTIDLSSYLDNTDELASLSCSPTEIAKWNGTNWACAADEVDDADSSATNEIQDLSLSGNTLSLTSDGTTVDLSSYLDNTDELAGLSCSPNEIAKYSGAAWACAADIDTTIADDQTLSFNSGTGELTIADGNMVDMSAFFDDTTVDNQQISLSGNIITLDNGTGADTTVNLTSYLDNTDSQDLSLAGNTLSLTNDASTVDLSSYLDNTDGQTLGLSGTTLSITGGNNVDIDPIIGNEVTNATANGGLERAGSGTAGDPYTLGLRTDCNTDEVIRYDGAEWVCSPPVYEKIAIWGEENAGIAANQDEYSFGNGATGNIGVPLAEDWEIYAVGFNADVNATTSTATIAIRNQDTGTNLHTFTTVASGTANILSDTQTLGTPVSVPAGTSLGFRTLGVAGGAITDARVVVYLRRLP